MDAKAYDEWYESSFGRWVGKKELDLIIKYLAPKEDESLLDIGCGTGYFTRKISPLVKKAVGVDIDKHRIGYARSVATHEEFLHADVLDLEFDDKSFDLVMAITSLGFVADGKKALEQMVRIAKKRVVVAVLNRNSTLWHIEGKTGGTGGYKGAHWHTADELKELLNGFDIKNLQFDSAIFSTKNSFWAKKYEDLMPRKDLKGAFLLASFEL